MRNLKTIWYDACDLWKCKAQLLPALKSVSSLLDVDCISMTINLRKDKTIAIMQLKISTSIFTHKFVITSTASMEYYPSLFMFLLSLSLFFYISSNIIPF